MPVMPDGAITRVHGFAVVLRGPDIDTDRIMPARFLRVLTFEGLGAHVFEDDRAAASRDGAVHPFDAPAATGASILIVNRNFGCGSSREHAPQGLLRWGIRAVVGESFSEIFFGNATTLGMPCVTAAPEAIGVLMSRVEAHPSPAVTIDLASGQAWTDGFSAAIELPEAVRHALVSGAWDATGLLLADFDQVRAVASRLPALMTGGR